MTLQGLAIFIAIMTFAFVSYLYKDYKETGGYSDDSDGYFGYLFPLNNGFTKVEDCNLAITEFPEVPPPSQEWMEGCKKYFEVN
ncbi:MAG: hypothetical protein E7I55_14505 [Acinetobacter ursingii]|nr:hypothetical protein [Acinetobacter ursingii]